MLSNLAQQPDNFSVEKLPELGSPLAEALQDNTVTPPPDAAAFRSRLSHMADNME